MGKTSANTLPSKTTSKSKIDSTVNTKKKELTPVLNS